MCFVSWFSLLQETVGVVRLLVTVTRSERRMSLRCCYVDLQVEIERVRKSTDDGEISGTVH